MLEVRTVRPVNEQPPGLFTQHTNRFIVDDDDMDSNTVTESDLSLTSRSFLHRVNDQVRKRQDQSSRCNTRQRQTFFIVVNVSVFDITSICIHGKGLLRKFTLHQKYNNLTMKHMFDISEKLKSDKQMSFMERLQLTGRFFMETMIFGQ